MDELLTPVSTSYGSSDKSDGNALYVYPRLNASLALRYPANLPPGNIQSLVCSSEYLQILCHKFTNFELLGLWLKLPSQELPNPLSSLLPPQQKLWSC